MTWLLIQTLANMERNAENALTHASRQFQCYFPKIKTFVRHARRCEAVVRPFLPRYGFVVDDGRGVREIKDAPGVSSIVKVGLQPARVEQFVIDAIRSRENDEGFVQLDDQKQDPRCAFEHGQRVRVFEGSMRGMDAVFLEPNGLKRAFIMLSLLGTRRSVSIDLDAIRAV